MTFEQKTEVATERGKFQNEGNVRDSHKETKETKLVETKEQSLRYGTSSLANKSGHFEGSSQLHYYWWIFPSIKYSSFLGVKNSRKVSRIGNF